jgi:hypothetical protein
MRFPRRLDQFFGVNPEGRAGGTRPDASCAANNATAHVTFDGLLVLGGGRVKLASLWRQTQHQPP